MHSFYVVSDAVFMNLGEMETAAGAGMTVNRQY